MNVLLTLLVGFSAPAFASISDYPRFAPLEFTPPTRARLETLLERADMRGWFDQIHLSFPEVERVLQCDELLGPRALRRETAAARMMTVMSYADVTKPFPRQAFLHLFKLFSVVTLEADLGRVKEGERLFDAWAEQLMSRRSVDLNDFFARPENLRGLRRFAAVYGETVWGAHEFPPGATLD